MQPECTAQQYAVSPAALLSPAWRLTGEQTIVAPFSDGAVEYAVISLLPSGPWTLLLDRALVADVVAAVLYMQCTRGISQVYLQSYQLCNDGKVDGDALVASSPAASLAQASCVPAGACGWSFFLVEKTLADGHAVVQIYLFHE